MNGELVRHLEALTNLIRYYILLSTTTAGSGHPTSSLSGVELMTSLLFGSIFRYDETQPEHPNNDRLIFSKGHASPLLYALWAAAGWISEEELQTMRQFGSRLEGHPSVALPYVEAATGSLGQGLSIGLGMALNAKYPDKLPYKTYVFLGDSEMSEGSQWEAIQLAAEYRLDNLTAILDVNRLGQRGETMYGHNIAAYEKRVSAFGWETIAVDGHSIPGIIDAYEMAGRVLGRPVMIIAKTIKGKGISFLEDRNGWHGRVLKQEEFREALSEIGPVDKSLKGDIAKPLSVAPGKVERSTAGIIDYPSDRPVATRRAYGNALARIAPRFPEIVVLDGEVGNSTYANIFGEAWPERFFEMYIAEQNMVGVALGLSRRGKIPFVSTFAAFMTRAFDQIRMTAYSESNIKFMGSHGGVSTGQDGPSQMGLEDIGMFRAVMGSVVLYPCDAVSTEKLVEAAAAHFGNVYIRTTRGETPILYGADEDFPIGGSKVLRQDSRDAATVVAAGITVFEALRAYEELKSAGTLVRVVDLYSIKPIDRATLEAAAAKTRAVITVEDHFPEGGLGEAVRSALEGHSTPVYSLAVRKMPKSGTPAELLDYEGISWGAIVRKVKDLLLQKGVV
jgi:transketolase